MTNCIIVHGGPGSTPPAKHHDLGERHWMGWLNKELNSRGIKTDNPEMPNPWNPVYEDYKKEFEKYHIDENTILVGHSHGCAFLVRWLGDSKQKIKKLILVAPYKIAVGDNKFKKEFYNFDIDPSIKNRVEEIIIFTSNDEEEEGKMSVKMYYDAIGGQIINLKDHGHYTTKYMGTIEFPEILQKIIS